MYALRRWQRTKKRSPRRLSTSGRMPPSDRPVSPGPNPKSNHDPNPDSDPNPNPAHREEVAEQAEHQRQDAAQRQPRQQPEQQQLPVPGDPIGSYARRLACSGTVGILLSNSSITTKVYLTFQERIESICI